MKKSLIATQLQALFGSGKDFVFHVYTSPYGQPQRPAGALKWCYHCHKDTHDAAECWCTRMVR